MHQGDIDGWDEGHEEINGVISTGEGVRVVLDVVLVHMVGECCLGIFVDVELLDEFVEDGRLCGFICGRRRAVGSCCNQGEECEDRGEDVGLHLA